MVLFFYFLVVIICGLICCGLTIKFSDVLLNTGFLTASVLVIPIGVILTLVAAVLMMVNVDRVIANEMVEINTVSIDNADVLPEILIVDLGNDVCRINTSLLNRVDLADSAYSEPTLVVTARVYHFCGFEEASKGYSYTLYR